MNLLLHLIFKVFFLKFPFYTKQDLECNLAGFKEISWFKKATPLPFWVQKVFLENNSSSLRQSKRHNLSFLNVLLFSVSLLCSHNTYAQVCVTPPVSGGYTFVANTRTCFTENATLGDITIQDGAEIYIEHGVMVIIQNNVSSSGNIKMNIEGTLQFNQVTRINANVQINISDTGILKSGETGANDFALQGNGTNTILNDGLMSMGVLDFNNANANSTIDNNGTIQINANVNIGGVMHFKNSGILNIGSSYNCKETSVFVNCGVMTSGNGFNLDGGKVYNSGDFIVTGGNINFGRNTARFDNTGRVDIQNGQLLLGGNGSEYYNEGLTQISNNIQNDGTIRGPDVGSGKLGYMSWRSPAVMNSGSIGPNLNLKSTNGASTQAAMFNNQNITFVSPLQYDCMASNNCVAPLIEVGEICRNPDGSLGFVIKANDDDYRSTPVIPRETINTPITSNDTLNDQSVILGTSAGEVSITSVTGDSEDLILDPTTGMLSVSPGTVSGTYNLTYTICENGVSPENCDTAYVIVFVHEILGPVCTESIDGENFQWNYPGGSGTISETMTQPGSTGGFQFDFYELDNSFNMEINGVQLAEYEIEFQSNDTPSPGINIEFEDGDQYETNTDGDIWTMRGSTERPLIRVSISPTGEVSMFGSKTSGGVLFPLRFKQNVSPINYFNTIQWNADSDNIILVTQNIVGVTLIEGVGSGQNIVPCDTYTLTKDGVFNDENGDGIAQLGETITYTLRVKNVEDMDIYNLIVEDPMLGGEVNVVPSGDDNNDGILNIYEEWVYIIDYLVTQDDIDNKGVYNLATVSGANILNENLDPETSTDPTPLDSNDPMFDPSRPDHTFVPLRGRSLMITNPNIYQKVKSN